jgi:hypothetical protein
MFYQKRMDVVLPDHAQARFIQVGHHEVAVADLGVRAVFGAELGVEAL